MHYRPRQNYKNSYCQSDTRLQLGIRIRRAVSFGPTAKEIFLLISSTSLVHERCLSIIINPSDFALILLVHSASTSILKYLIFNNNFESILNHWFYLIIINSVFATFRLSLLEISSDLLISQHQAMCRQPIIFLLVSSANIHGVAYLEHTCRPLM